MEANYLGWSSTMAPTIMGAPNQPALGQELTNSFCRTDPDIARHFARVTFLSDHRAQLPLLTTPTLILRKRLGKSGQRRGGTDGRRSQLAGFQRCGSSVSISLARCVGSRVSTSLKYA